MSVRIQASQLIERPVAQVFRFYAVEHVRNHPHWDPDIWLEKAVGGPLTVGSRIRRRNSRGATPVDGSMEVVEFEPERAFGVLIHDGPTEMRGRATFEAEGPGKTRLTVHLEIPDMDESADTGFLARRVQRSVDKIKELIESEFAA